MVGNFVEEWKAVNAQFNQRIDIVERTLNKIIDGLQNDIAHKIDNLQYSISRLTNQHQVQEKRKFPSQTQQNPKGVHHIASSSEPTPNIDEVKTVITLRSGRKVEYPMPKPLDETKEREDEEPEMIVIKEDMIKKNMPPLFPQALISTQIVIF